MNNPFQYQSPVIGKDFFGRQDIISGILDNEQLSHVWIIGTRRSGKTSLLKQLEHIVHNKENYSKKYIPVYWSMEGVADAQGLQKRLAGSLWDLNYHHKNMFDLLGIDIAQLESMSIEDIFQKIGRSVMLKNIQLVLLCDEVEQLVNISKKDKHISSVLRHYFQSKWTRTIIVATGALWNLKEKDKGVSPFLSGFTPPQYILRRFTRREALALIRKGKKHGPGKTVPNVWEKKICQASNQMPYYMQLLCAEVCNSKPSSMDEAIARACHYQDLDVILENDLNGLTLPEKELLLYIVENSDVTFKELGDNMLKKTGENKGIFRALEDLQSLCYINQTSQHTYIVQNYFLQSWYDKNLRKIVEPEKNQKYTYDIEYETASLLPAKKESKLSGIKQYNFDLAIICALEDAEFESIKRLPVNWEKYTVPHDGTHYYTCFFDNGKKLLKVVAAASPQMGMPAASVLTMKLIQNFCPKYLVMTGIAAGVHKKTNFGDILVADPSWDYGSGKLEIIDGVPAFFRDPQQLRLDTDIRSILKEISSDRTLLDEIKNGWQADPPEYSLKLHIGPVASGASVLAHPSAVEAIKKYNRKLIGIDMETYGVLYAAANCPQPRPIAFSMKSVCDFADSEKNDNYQRYAAYTSSVLLHKLALNYLSFCGFSNSKMTG